MFIGGPQYSLDTFCPSNQRPSDRLDTGVHPKPSFAPYLLTESADVVNILLHLIYELPYSHFNPGLNSLLSTMQSLKKYGLPLHHYFDSSDCPLFKQVLILALLDPLEVFVHAAQLKLDSLAVAVSAYLLNFKLANLSDDIATAMGATYCKRLINLIHGREQTLRGLLATPLVAHPVTSTCGFVEHKILGKEWVIACSVLGHEATADTSTSLIRSTLKPLQDSTRCPSCKASIHSQAKDIIQKWTLTKRTI